MIETRASKGRFLTGPSVRAVRLLFKRMDPEAEVLEVAELISYFRDRLVPGDRLTEVILCLGKAMGPFSGERRQAASAAVMATLLELGRDFPWRAPASGPVKTAAPPPITLDTSIADYWREESRDEKVRESAMAGWLADLQDAKELYPGVAWNDASSISGAELQYDIPLAAAFWLELNREWYADASGELGELLAHYLPDEHNVDDGEARDDPVARIQALWSAYGADPANKEKT